MVEISPLQRGTTRHGEMVWPRCDRVIGTSLALYGEFAESENRVIRRYLKPGDWALDIGANLGTTMLPMTHRVGPTGHVIGFEPQPLIAQCLMASLSNNNILHSRVITAACGKKNTFARVPVLNYLGASNYGAVSLSDAGIVVPVITIDSLDLSRCDLIKIDVEGHEWDVIQGAEKTLLRFHPVLYIESKQIPGTRSTLAWLMQHGWRCFWHFSAFFTPDNFYRNLNNIFGNSGDMNFFAFPEGAALPDDMPEIKSADENWKDVYEAFYKDRPLPGMKDET